MHLNSNDPNYIRFFDFFKNKFNFYATSKLNVLIKNLKKTSKTLKNLKNPSYIFGSLGLDAFGLNARQYGIYILCSYFNWKFIILKLLNYKIVFFF